MGISKLQGTPFHIETLNSNGIRRGKYKCIHYRDGYCNSRFCKCTGSAHCTSYFVKENVYIKEEILNKQVKVKLKNEKLINKEKCRELFNKTGVKYSGCFTVKIDDSIPKKFILSKNIQKDTLLANSVYKHKKNDEYSLLGHKIFVLKNGLIKEDD